jgi:UDP-glucose 4-epimerase
MRILVTGGAGFIGSHVVDAYVEAGHQVIIVDDLSTGRRENLNPAATFYEIDIRDPDLGEVFERERPEVISHHAAQIAVLVSVRDPHFDADVNIMGSLNLLECAKAYRTRKVIFISSGGAIYGEPVSLPCTEDHPVYPLSPYGASKYAFEKYLHVYASTYDIDYTVLRYANVYGPRQDPHGEAGVVAIFVGKMLRGEAPRIYGSGEQERDFVYVGDVARGNLLSLEKGSRREYNLGTGKGSSINEIADHLKALTHYAGDVPHDPAKAGEVFKIYIDASRAREELGWQAEVDLREGLGRTVAYFQEQEASSEVVGD